MGRPTLPATSLSEELETMEEEHTKAGEELKKMHVIANGYVMPDDACNSYRALYSALSDFEADMFRHVNKENYALQTRLRLMESELMAGSHA